MNFNSIPYEAGYSEDGMNAIGMQGGTANSMGMGIPISMPASSINQMQLPMGSMPMPISSAGPMSYPMQRPMMQSQPMGMMHPMQQAPGNQVAMSMSQLTPGAVTPLSSVSVMPMMGGGGGIDGGGLNVIVPDLQPLSAMPQMSPNAQMPQMQHGRMAGGACAGNTNWMHSGQANKIMPNDMWNYGQGYPNMQQQQHHQHHHQQQQQHLQQQHLQQQHLQQQAQHLQQQHLEQQEQQQQEQQQQHQYQQRMKPQYEYSSNSFRESRNGLNSPQMPSNGNISGKKATHWR